MSVVRIALPTVAEMFDMARHKRFIGVSGNIAKIERLYRGKEWPCVTSPASRRLRWPFGLCGASVFDGWFCTREQMLAGPFVERDPRDEFLAGREILTGDPGWIFDKDFLAKWDERIHDIRQTRIGFTPSGEVLA